MCKRALNNYVYTILIPIDVTKKIWNKDVSFFSAIEFVSKCYNTQEMCDKSVSNNVFMRKYCLDIYETHKMCDKSVDDCSWLAYYK